MDGTRRGFFRAAVTVAGAAAGAAAAPGLTQGQGHQTVPAQDLGEKPQHVYSVRFTARELWGDGAKPRDAVVVAMWDDYLEPA